MKRGSLHNDRLDTLMTGLLRATALSDDEVENVAAGPDLFGSVRARIITDSVAGRHGGGFSVFQRTAILSAAVAVIVIAVFGSMLAVRRPQKKNVAAATPPQQQQQPANYTDIKTDAPASGVTTVVPELPDDVDDIPANGTRMPHVERALDYRSLPERRDTPKQRPLPQLPEPQPEFYALAGLRASEESVAGGRIIRVELPKASLVALGVNVPLDSDRQMIKTDLLVGPDGVPRAIRLVE